MATIYSIEISASNGAQSISRVQKKTTFSALLQFYREWKRARAARRQRRLAEQTGLLADHLSTAVVYSFEGPGMSKQESGNTNNSGNHGVINYNYYNQQWQNSVDLEHAMEANATSYGGAGGGDSTHNSNRLENWLLGGLKAAGNILPLLGDSTTEEFENSDRIGKKQAGASTLITQHTVGTRTYRQRGDGGISSVADPPTTAGPSVDRYISYTLGSWTASHTAYDGWAVPLPYGILDQDTPLASLARRHFITNCGYSVQVQLNSTRFHGGALGVFMVPQFVLEEHKTLTKFEFDASELTEWNPQSFFVFPHQIINPRTNSSAEVDVPYAHTTPGCNPRNSAPWTLVVLVLETLTYAEGATTALEISVSIKPDKTQFHGIRQSNEQFEGLPKVKLSSSSYSWASTQPHYAEPDYGAVVRSSPRYLPAPITDLLQIAQIPTLLFQRIAVVRQTVPNTPMLTVNVSLSATDLANTALETVSRGFAQYRGSIVVRAVFVGNQMQNTRVVMAYTAPGSDPPGTVEEAMQGIYTIFDTGLNSTFNFVIPFVSVSDYRLCNTTTLSDVSSGGYFSMWQLTTLAVPPGSPPQASFLVFAAAGQDFEFRLPTSPYMPMQGDDQLAAAETGVTPPHTADNSVDGGRQIPMADKRLSHSSVRFWMDRFFPSFNITLQNASLSTKIPLTWENLTQNIPEVRFFHHATYFRFELELAIRWHDTSATAGYVIALYPPGAVIPEGNEEWKAWKSDGQSGRLVWSKSQYHGGATPVWVAVNNNTPIFTTRIPFLSPAAAFSQTYNGWTTWEHTPDTFGVNNTNTFGTLVVVANVRTEQSLFVSMRMVDIQCWCPRPGMFVRVKQPRDCNSLGATNYSLLKLCGDVEENPGPTVMSLLGKLDPDFDEIWKKFQAMKSTLDRISDYATWIDLWNNADKMYWLKKICKFLAYGVILLRAKSDPLLAAAAGFLLAGDWVSAMCSKIVKHIKENAATEPPPFPSVGSNSDGKPVPQPRSRNRNENEEQQVLRILEEAQRQYAGNPFEEEEDGTGEGLLQKLKNLFRNVPKFEGPIQDANSIFQLLRNAHWLSDRVKAVMEWLGLWKKQEEEASVENFKEKMLKFPEMMAKYEQCRCSPRHQGWQQCKEYFDEMRALAARHDIKVINLFPHMVEPQECQARQEPLLVVLRGPPGQGKSLAATLLAQMCSHHLTGKPDYYSYNSSTNFFDGYTGQPVVVIDDLGQNPSGTDFSVFCQMISTTTFHPNMADLKEKGIRFTSDIIIATTNLPNFNPVSIADPGALRRRINFDFEVTAGPGFRTNHNTLNLDLALKPTGCVSPAPFCKQDINLFSSACLCFKDKNGARCSCSIIEVYNKIMQQHQNRNQLSLSINNIFTFQGPRPHNPRETPAPRCPRQKDVQRWCDLAITVDIRDDAVLHFIRQNFDHALFQAYVKRFYQGGPDPFGRPPVDVKKALDMISMICQILALIMMVLSFGIVIYQICTMEGAYGDATKKRPKQKGLKVVDIASFQGPTNQDMEMSILKKNMVKIHFERLDGSTFTTGGLAVKNRIVVVNNHLYQQATKVQFDGGWYPIQCIPAVQPQIDGTPGELVFMNFGATPGRMYRDIRVHFPTHAQLRINRCAKAVGIHGHSDVPFLFEVEPLGVFHSARTWEARVPEVLKYKANTAPGFCGSVIVVDAGVYKKIFGIHCAGGHGIGMAAIITQEMLQLFDELPELQGLIHDVQPHPYIYTPRRTALYPTVACDEDTTVEPAALSCNDKRLEDPPNFKKVILSKHIGDRTDGPIGMIRAARAYARMIKAKCGDVTQRLSLRQAVFGTDNLDPMDMSRSPGWPYIGNKRRVDLIKDCGDHLELDQVLGAELMLMQQGNFQHHKFVTFLKDELRDKEKVKAGKTRVIDIASFGHAIFGRVLFGNLAAAMHAHNGVDIGSAVGTNPDIDWTRYANEFKHKYFVDIDYSGFDATHTTFSFFCLKEFLKELGFDGVALAYVDSLCNSTHIWDDEIYQITGGLPSGCSCTSIFNTIMNNIVVRCFVSAVHDGEFQLLAYGDDLVLCSDTPFDVELYKLLLESLTNYKITPASKSGSFEWTSLEKVVFLKRYFKPDGLLVRPVMTYKNLHNILSYARAGTITEKLASVARLAQHRGKADYDRLFAPFEDCGYLVPSFDDLEMEFFSLFFG